MLQKHLACNTKETVKEVFNWPSSSQAKVSKAALKKGTIWYLLGPEEAGARLKVVLNGLFGALTLFGIFTSLHLIPAAEATAIFFMAPIFTFVFSLFILKEPFTILRVAISLIVIIGVGLVTRPKPIFDLFGNRDDTLDDIEIGFFLSANQPQKLFNHTQNLRNYTRNEINKKGLDYPETKQITELAFGYICALVVPASASMITILSRQLAQLSTEALNIPLLMMWQGFGSITIGLILYAALNDSSVDNNVGLLWCAIAIGVVLFGTMGNIFLALSTKFISPSLVNVIRCTEVVFMCFIQLELSDSVHDQIFYMEYGFGILALLIAGILICFESRMSQCFSKN